MYNYIAVRDRAYVRLLSIAPNIAVWYYWFSWYFKLYT